MNQPRVRKGYLVWQEIKLCSVFIPKGHPIMHAKEILSNEPKLIEISKQLPTKGIV